MALKLLLPSILLVLVMMSGNSHAGVDDYRTSTWNLQGSSAQTESKWGINVRQMVSPYRNDDHSQILAIQEAGNPPASAHRLPSPGQPDGVPLYNPTGVPANEFFAYIWDLGGEPAALRFIYYWRNPSETRVSLAIVTEREVDGVIVLGESPITARPVFGIQIGDDYFFSMHASASGGGDGPDIVDTIRDYFTTTSNFNAEWMILGDFNRTPSSFTTAMETQYPDTYAVIRVVHQDYPTHLSGAAGGTNRNLDYAVVGRLRNTVPRLAGMRFVVGLGNQRCSDHIPVRFNATQ